MPRTIAAILMTFMLALSAAPARTSEAATADDTARFLVGLPPSSKSPLAALAKDPAWLSHARYFDSIFAREESAQLSKVREFSKKYLTDKHGSAPPSSRRADFKARFVKFGEDAKGAAASVKDLDSFKANIALRRAERDQQALLGAVRCPPLRAIECRTSRRRGRLHLDTAMLRDDNVEGR